jgi:hypothetical protein
MDATRVASHDRDDFVSAVTNFDGPVVLFDEVIRGIKHLLGMSLDQARDILYGQGPNLDPLRLSLQVQLMRIILIVAGKALLNGSYGPTAPGNLFSMTCTAARSGRKRAGLRPNTTTI